MAKRAYYREPASAPESRGRIDSLMDSGEITEDLAEALYIALDHQAQLDYDGLYEEYRDTESGELKQLLVDIGVVIVLSEEQTKKVKYGV